MVKSTHHPKGHRHTLLATSQVQGHLLTVRGKEKLPILSTLDGYNLQYVSRAYAAMLLRRYRA